MPVKSIHIAQAIREDLSDAYLRREVCPGLKTKDGRTPTVAELRAAFAEARANGYEVLPPCDNVDERGMCKGHPVEDEPPAAMRPTDEEPAPAPERPGLPAVWDLVLADMAGRLSPPPCFEVEPQKVYIVILRLAQGLAASLGSDIAADMRERDITGRARYGTPLQPFNGRRALVDAYQELLDAVVYLRQHMYEAKHSAPEGIGDRARGQRRHRGLDGRRAHRDVDVLTDEFTDADLDIALREAGGDPVAIGRRGADLARELLERRRLAWQEAARRKLARARGLLLGDLDDA